MFDRGRSHRAYRVYAEDEFLETDPGADSAASGDSQRADVPSYTAPARRGMPGPLGGRAGVVLIALVAMAVSALVVHALRVGLGSGGVAPRTAAAPVSGAVTRAGGRASLRGSVRVRGAALGVSPRARGIPVALRGEVGDRKRDRARRRAVRVRTGGASVGEEQLGRRSAPVLATASESGDAGSPSTIATAAPEFGFER